MTDTPALSKLVLVISEQERDRHLRRIASVMTEGSDDRYRALICAETLRDLLNAMRPEKPQP